MRYAIQTNIVNFTAMMVIAAAMTIGGLVTLHPANSAQARPLLDELQVPDCNLSYQDNPTTYRDTVFSTAEPTPPSPPNPVIAHVTVREGDLFLVRRILACHAKVYGATVHYTYDGFEIGVTEGWQPFLLDLNPATEPDQDHPSHAYWRHFARNNVTAGYDRWAKSAAAELAAAGPEQTAAPLPPVHDLRVSFSHATAGNVSDADARMFGWLLIGLAAAVTVGTFIWIALEAAGFLGP